MNIGKIKNENGTYLNNGTGLQSWFTPPRHALSYLLPYRIVNNFFACSKVNQLCKPVPLFRYVPFAFLILYRYSFFISVIISFVNRSGAPNPESLCSNRYNHGLPYERTWYLLKIILYNLSSKYTGDCIIIHLNQSLFYSFLSLYSLFTLFLSLQLSPV